MKTRILSACLALAVLGTAACSSSKSNVKADEGTATAQGNLDQSFRAKAPAPGPSPELVTPVFKEATLKNGLKVIVSERHELPVVAVSVAFASGSAQDPRGKAGTANLAYALLLEGAGNRDALALADAFADLGTSPFSQVGADGAVVGTSVLKRNAEPALQLLADIVQRPTFAAADFERRKQEQLATLALQSSSPGYMAQEAIAPTVFGETHPYGHLGAGTPASVAAVKLADAKGFYTQRAGPKAAALILAGDVTLDQAVAWGEKYFGGWKGAAQAPAEPPQPKVAQRGQVVVVPKPGLQQTIVVLGRPAIEAGSPDEAALELATQVFGGYFGSRLNMNLREAKGYSYGARSGVDGRRGVGSLSVSSAVRADVTGPALTEVMKELQGLKEKPITAEELAAAKEGVIRGFPGMFEDVDALAITAASLYWEGQPLDRFNKLITGLQAADAATVQAAATKYFDPGLMQIVLVGDPELIKTQVAPLNLGTLKTRTPPAAPGAPAKAKAGGAAGASR